MHEVRAALGSRPNSDEPLATALTLFDEVLRAELWKPELSVVGMSPAPDVAEGSSSPTSSQIEDAAARQLEIFLDLVAYHAADLEQFVLDDTYAAMLNEDERTLRDLLHPLTDQVEVLQGTSLGRRLVELLEECGATLR